MSETINTPELDKLTLEAIRTVRAALARDWISDGCRRDKALNCASCQAVIMDEMLEMFETEYEMPFEWRHRPRGGV